MGWRQVQKRLDRLTQKAVVLFSEHNAQGNNSHDYQAELEQSAIYNHRHHLPHGKVTLTAKRQLLIFILAYFKN